MRIILTTENTFSAARLRDRILKAVKGDLPEETIDTWSYARATDSIDVIFHNPPQYVEVSENNVLFRVDLNGENVIFSTAFWSRNPKPSMEMNCLHVGRLTEMILVHFLGEFSKFSILER